MDHGKILHPETDRLTRKQLLAEHWRLVWIWIKSHLILSVVITLTAVTVVIAYLEAKVEVGAAGSNITSFYDSLWWAVVTVLTIGYGDRFPVTPAGRLLGVVLMFAGVLSVAILTSKIASIFMEQVL